MSTARDRRELHDGVINHLRAVFVEERNRFDAGVFHDEMTWLREIVPAIVSRAEAQNSGDVFPASIGHGLNANTERENEPTNAQETETVASDGMKTPRHGSTVQRRQHQPGVAFAFSSSSVAASLLPQTPSAARAAQRQREMMTRSTSITRSRSLTQQDRTAVAAVGAAAPAGAITGISVLGENKADISVSAMYESRPAPLTAETQRTQKAQLRQNLRRSSVLQRQVSAAPSRRSSRLQESRNEIAAIKNEKSLNSTLQLGSNADDSILLDNSVDLDVTMLGSDLPGQSARQTTDASVFIMADCSNVRSAPQARRKSRKSSSVVDFGNSSRGPVVRKRSLRTSARLLASRASMAPSLEEHSCSTNSVTEKHLQGRVSALPEDSESTFDTQETKAFAAIEPAESIVPDPESSNTLVQKPGSASDETSKSQKTRKRGACKGLEFEPPDSASAGSVDSTPLVEAEDDADRPKSRKTQKIAEEPSMALRRSTRRSAATEISLEAVAGTAPVDATNSSGTKKPAANNSIAEQEIVTAEKENKQGSATAAIRPRRSTRRTTAVSATERHIEQPASTARVRRSVRVARKSAAASVVEQKIESNIAIKSLSEDSSPAASNGAAVHEQQSSDKAHEGIIDETAETTNVTRTSNILLSTSTINESDRKRMTESSHDRVSPEKICVRVSMGNLDQIERKKSSQLSQPEQEISVEKKDSISTEESPTNKSSSKNKSAEIRDSSATVDQSNRSSLKGSTESYGKQSSVERDTLSPTNTGGEAAECAKAKTSDCPASPTSESTSNTELTTPPSKRKSPEPATLSTTATEIPKTPSVKDLKNLFQKQIQEHVQKQRFEKTPGSTRSRSAVRATPTSAARSVDIKRTLRTIGEDEMLTASKTKDGARGVESQHDDDETRPLQVVKNSVAQRLTREQSPERKKLRSALNEQCAPAGQHDTQLSARERLRRIQAMLSKPSVSAAAEPVNNPDNAKQQNESGVDQVENESRNKRGSNEQESAPAETQSPPKRRRTGQHEETAGNASTILGNVARSRTDLQTEIVQERKRTQDAALAEQAKLKLKIKEERQRAIQQQQTQERQRAFEAKVERQRKLEQQRRDMQQQREEERQQRIQEQQIAEERRQHEIQLAAQKVEEERRRVVAQQQQEQREKEERERERAEWREIQEQNSKLNATESKTTMPAPAFTSPKRAGYVPNRSPFDRMALDLRKAQRGALSAVDLDDNTRRTVSSLMQEVRGTENERALALNLARAGWTWTTSVESGKWRSGLDHAMATAMLTQLGALHAAQQKNQEPPQGRAVHNAIQRVVGGTPVSTNTSSASIASQSPVVIPANGAATSEDDESDYSDSDESSDEDEELASRKRNAKKVRGWAEAESLRRALQRQQRVDPHSIFPEVQSCDLDEIFDTQHLPPARTAQELRRERRRRRRIATRSSSARWTPDGASREEISRYRQAMGYAGATPILARFRRD